MRSSVYVYVLLALTSSLTLAAPLSTLERRIVLPPNLEVGTPSAPPPLPTFTKDPLSGYVGPVIVTPIVNERAEGRREFSNVARQSNPAARVSSDFGASRVKRADGVLGLS
ncbi:hypothetical protein BC826DRAFT_995299 [Russula brevipes]|nr:hypothetical protein BC826DRAFT_995299 [Russula brevipes]